MSSIDDLRSELREPLTGLHRAKHLTAAIVAYREAFLKEIRSLVRRPLPSSNDDDNDSTTSSSTRAGKGHLSQQQKSSILVRNLRLLDPEDAEKLLLQIYIGITEALRRLTTQVRLLLDVASTLGDEAIDATKCPQLDSIAKRSPTVALEAEEIHKAIDLPDLLGQAVDVAQDKIVKLLRVRSEQSARLPLAWFLRYFNLNLCFTSECESISGRSSTSLKTVVNGQITDFVQYHGDEQKQKLALGMEAGQWEAMEFTESDSAVLGRILSCSTKDPSEWVAQAQIGIPCSDDDALLGGYVDLQPSSAVKTQTRNASIDEETFVLPSSAILCMHGLSNFLQLCVGIPSMTADIGASLVSYLRYFNTRCTQLILDAGARQSAGLKNITSKHLVLASRALAFIATLISHIREYVRRYARGGAAGASVVEFDKVKRLYQEHQNSIYDKIVEIMSRLAASHVKAMASLDWNESQGNAHPYMISVSRGTASLHRILTKTLPESTVTMLMTTVFLGYKNQFSKAFRDLDPKTEQGRDSMLHDIEFFQSKLGKMAGFGDTGEYLAAIVKSKSIESVVPAAPEPEAAAAPSPAAPVPEAPVEQTLPVTAGLEPKIAEKAVQENANNAGGDERD